MLPEVLDESRQPESYNSFMRANDCRKQELETLSLLTELRSACPDRECAQHEEDIWP